MANALTPEGVRSLVLQITLSQNPNFHRLLNCLTTLADLELLVDVLQVSIDGCCGNEQFVGNFLVAQPLGQQIQNIELAIGQGLKQWLLGSDHGRRPPIAVLIQKQGPF